MIVGGAVASALRLDRLQHFAGDLQEQLAHRMLRPLGHDRLARVAPSSSSADERDAAEKGDAELGGDLCAATAAEQLFTFPALRALVVAHVLDDPEHGGVDLLKHGNPALHVQPRHLLRGGDHDTAGQRHLLHQSELGVAVSGRKVNHQDIQLPPVHTSQELADQPRDQRPAPNHRGVVIEEEAQGHHLKTYISSGRCACPWKPAADQKSQHRGRLGP